MPHAEDRRSPPQPRAAVAALAALAALLAAALAAPPGAAVAGAAGGDDPPPPTDLLGLYRQPDATGGSADTLAILEQGTFYAVLTDCSAGGGLVAYGFEVEPPAGIPGTIEVLCTSPCWKTDFLPPSEVVCNCLDVPLPLAGAMTLATVRYLPFAAGSGAFHLHPSETAGGMIYLAAGDETEHAMGWAAGSEAAAAFQLVVQQATGAEGRTWGALKALYRGTAR